MSRNQSNQRIFNSMSEADLFFLKSSQDKAQSDYPTKQSQSTATSKDKMRLSACIAPQA